MDDEDVQRYYRMRDREVRLLGFDGYLQYLQSELWKTIRARVLARDKGVCLLCGEPATEVHHVRYTRETLRGDDDTRLASLCRSCHYTVEYTAGNVKRSVPEAEEVYLHSYHARHS